MFKKVLIAGATAIAMTTSAFSADIVDTASEAGDFATLVAAVEAAGLVETLKGEGHRSPFSRPRTRCSKPFRKAPSTICSSKKTGISSSPSLPST